MERSTLTLFYKGCWTTVTYSQDGVGVLVVGSLDDSLELLLARSPLLFRDMEVTYQRPRICVILKSEMKDHCSISTALLRQGIVSKI